MNPLVTSLLHESPSQLRRRLVQAHPIDPGALEGWAYRGISLGLPQWMERLSWKTFQKTFWREPLSGRLLGWNVRLEQDGLDAPSRPKQKHGLPVTTWHYEVLPPGAVPMPDDFAHGLVIDYGRGANSRLDAIRFSRDPLVALEPGSAEVLLGVTVVGLGPACVETPTWFVLEREHPVSYVPEAARAGRPMLLPFERRWAARLLEALLGQSEPLTDTEGFFALLARSGPPYLGPALRAAVHGLTFLPVAMPGLWRPFFALSPQQRAQFIERLADDRRPAVKSALSTLKMVACFAAFEDDLLRRHHTGLEEVLQ